ncbi:hypothetical protein SteCoe_21291 [Stentor coeruleus]|uniref:Uncharacterized protein n=1 Tax=Stentor coeruleus TaxID=5963 RepID=A0A1R2BPP5_9CILI|nr:hypothetical protein SteCoe_21291 [Stentor coeruleus]
MVSKPNKNWVDMFSIKNIKQLVTQKRKCIIDPYDFFKTEDLRSNPLSPRTLFTSSTPVLPKFPKKLIPIHKSTLCQTKRSELAPGIAEEKYQIVNDLCLVFQKNLRTTMAKVRRSKKFIRSQYRSCKKIAKNAYEERDCEGIPQDFVAFSEKLKEKKSSKKNRQNDNLLQL